MAIKPPVRTREPTRLARIRSLSHPRSQAATALGARRGQIDFGDIMHREQTPMPSRLHRVASAALLACVLALLASCVTYSVHPLYDERTSVFEPRLVGTWIDASEPNRPTKIIFTKDDENAYRATYVDPDRGADAVFLYDAHLVKLGGRFFLDAVQTGVRVGNQDFDTEGIVSHLIARVSLDGDKLRLDLLDDDWLQKGFAAKTIALPHETTGSGGLDNGVVLTASTADLQKFVLAHAADDQAFPPSDPLVRAP